MGWVGLYVFFFCEFSSFVRFLRGRDGNIVYSVFGDEDCV